MSCDKVIQDSSENDSLSLSSVLDQVPKIFNIRPQDGANCRIILEAKNVEEFDYPTEEEFNFCIGESKSLLGDVIEDELRKLNVGEESCFVVAAEENDAQKELTVSVKLIQVENCIPVYQLSSEEKFEKAKFLKEKGVDLFKDGQLELAFRRFSRALKLLILMLPKDGIPESLSMEYQTLKTQCYSNLAACQLKVKSYDYVVSNCTKALEMEPSNVKCLYRRAEAYFCMKKYDLCAKDVTKGLELEPKSKTFRDLNEKLAEFKQT